ncbi:MAG: hypothetical protein EPN76_05060 [Burkholderiaceae bacterium]|nr:MAG: hypothetical protein EPN76_05060 [Burkholderiaceae bacterium]
MIHETLNVQGAADLMQVHPETVKELIASCALPAARVGRAYVLLRRDVMGHIEREVANQTARRLGRPKPKRAHRRTSPELLG